MTGMMYAQIAGGAIFGAINAYAASAQAEEEAKFGKRIARFQAQMARNKAIEQAQFEELAAQLRRRDADLAEAAARLSLEQAAAVGEDVRRQGRRYLSSLRAAAGAANIAIDEGSALLAQREAARLAEYDALLAEFGPKLDAFKSSEDAKLLRHEAEVNAQRAQYIREVGVPAAGALYDAQAEWLKRWEQYHADSRWGQVLLGAVAGALSASYNVPRTQERSAPQAYSYDRPGPYQTGERYEARFRSPEYQEATGRGGLFTAPEEASSPRAFTFASSQRSFYGMVPGEAP